MRVYLVKLDPSGNWMPFKVVQCIKIVSFFPTVRSQFHALFHNLWIVPWTYYKLNKLKQYLSYYSVESVLLFILKWVLLWFLSSFIPYLYLSFILQPLYFYGVHNWFSGAKREVFMAVISVTLLLVIAVLWIILLIFFCFFFVLIKWVLIGLIRGSRLLCACLRLYWRLLGRSYLILSIRTPLVLLLLDLLLFWIIVQGILQRAILMNRLTFRFIALSTQYWNL